MTRGHNICKRCGVRFAHDDRAILLEHLVGFKLCCESRLGRTSLGDQEQAAHASVQAMHGARRNRPRRRR